MAYYAGIPQHNLIIGSITRQHLVHSWDGWPPLWFHIAGIQLSFPLYRWQSVNTGRNSNGRPFKVRQSRNSSTLMTSGWAFVSCIKNGNFQHFLTSCPLCLYKNRSWPLWDVYRGVSGVYFPPSDSPYIHFIMLTAQVDGLYKVQVCLARLSWILCWANLRLMSPWLISFSMTVKVNKKRDVWI